MWVLWMLVIVLAFLKSRGSSKGETGEYINRREKASWQHSSSADSPSSEERFPHNRDEVNGVMYR
jgi:hypothetical protein